MTSSQETGLFMKGNSMVTVVENKPHVRFNPKVGRNEPCPCGSGKKFKKCHALKPNHFISN